MMLVSAGSSTHWENGIRTRYFTPSEDPLFDVWGLSTADYYAVGRYGAAAHFDGGGWQAMNRGVTADIRDVWVDQSAAIAVGEHGSVLRQSGTSWTEETIGTTYDLHGVWEHTGLSVAVGRRNINEFDWRQAILMNTGGGWTDIGPVGNAPQLFDVWGTHPSNVYAVGWAGEILHYDGDTWTTIDGDASNTAFLSSIHGIDTSHVMAVGRTNDLKGLVCRFDGGAWTKHVLDGVEELTSIWMFSPSDAIAVGAGGVIRRFDGTSWKSMKSSTKVALLSVWGSEPDDVYAGGVDGTLLHFDGSRWRELKPATNRTINAISGTSKTDVLFGGDKGMILQFSGL
jgi:hypothetical protein